MKIRPFTTTDLIDQGQPETIETRRRGRTPEAARITRGDLTGTTHTGQRPRIRRFGSV